MKTKKRILSLLAIAFSVAVHAQNWTSGVNSGGPYTQVATDVAEGNAGTSIVVGNYYHGRAIFGPDTLDWLTGYSGPTVINPNGFIVRYNPNNTVSWATKITSSSPAGVSISSVTTSSNGQIYVCGTYSYICNFYSASNLNTTAATLPGSANPQPLLKRGFVAKYSALGTLMWVRRGLGDSEVMTEVAVSADGSQLVVSGRIANQVSVGSTIIKPGSYVMWLNPTDGSAIRAFNYANDANYQVVNKTGLCIDNANNVIVAGRLTSGSTYSVQGASGSINVSSTETKPTIYAKYSSSGALLWARATGASLSTPYSTPSSLIVDESNNIYLGGWAGLGPQPGNGNYQLRFPTATGNLSIPVNGDNGYIVKLNSSNGYAVWTSHARNVASGSEAISLAKGGCNFVYACINTEANPTYTDASGTTNSPAISSQGLAIFPLNTNGQLLTTTPWIINGTNLVPAIRAHIAPGRNNTLKCTATASNNVSLQTSSGSITLSPAAGSNDVVLGTITYGGPAPTITFPENMEACEGSTIVLNAGVTGTPTFTYTWSILNFATSTYVPIGTSTSPTFSVSPAVYGQYIIQIFNARLVSFQLTVTDCSGITVSNNIGVILRQGIVYSQVSGVDVCYKDQITAPNAIFSVNTQNVTAYSWQYSANAGMSWNPCSGSGYTGANTATLTVVGPTSGMNNYLFRCKLEGCPTAMETNAAVLTVTPCPMRPVDLKSAVAGNERIIGNDAQLSLYPNPANTTLEIVFENGAASDDESEIEAYVLDMTGRKVLEVPFGNGHHTLEVSDLQNGTYSFVVSTKGKVIDQQKFIVMH